MKIWLKCISIKKIILLSSIILLFCAAFFFRHYFSLFYFQSDLNPIAVNIELKNNNKEEIYVCHNKLCDLTKCDSGVCTFLLNKTNKSFYDGKVSELEVILKNDKIDEIRSISIFNGFNSVSEFQITKIRNNEAKFQGNNSAIIKIALKDNSKPLISRFAIYFESIFYNWEFYIFSYILILIYLIKYQERFDIKIKYPIILILILGLFLRLSHITYVPLWNDELYSLCFMSNMGLGFNLKRTFLDAGNPPLFFIMSNIWLYFFHKTTFIIRLLPCIIGIAQIYVLYFVLKKILNKKTALIAAFLSAINLCIIFESNEIRSYILSITLIPVELYLFYKLKNEYSNLYLILYFIISSLLINTHYYCVFFVFSNFILGEILFKNKRIQFLICNFISFLSLLPYLLFSLKKSLSDNFNSWIPYPNIKLLSDHITFYFGNIVFFIICILFCIYAYKKLSKNEKFIFLYNICSIACVFVLVFLVSIFIKPILFERYFSIFLPLLIINTALLLNIDFKTKFKPLIYFAIFLFSINMPKYETYNLFSNINPIMNYFYYDSKMDKDYTPYVVVPDSKYYANYFKKIPKDKIIVAQLDNRADADLISLYLSKIPKNNKKIVLYVPEMRTNKESQKLKKERMKLIETNMTTIYKIYIN